MLRIAKLTDYALRILSHMANEPESILSATSLARSLHLTTPTVSKILKILLEAQLVGSVRGVEGGYHLARPAVSITVADIIQAMEGDLAITECCKRLNLCNLKAICTMQGNWQTINKAIYKFLASVTISDMVNPAFGTSQTEGPDVFQFLSVERG